MCVCVFVFVCVIVIVFFESTPCAELSGAVFCPSFRFSFLFLCLSPPLSLLFATVASCPDRNLTSIAGFMTPLSGTLSKEFASWTNLLTLDLDTSYIRCAPVRVFPSLLSPDPLASVNWAFATCARMCALSCGDSCARVRPYVRVWVRASVCVRMLVCMYACKVCM